MENVLSVLHENFVPKLSPSPGVYTSILSSKYEAPEFATDENSQFSDISRFYKEYNLQHYQKYFTQLFNMQLQKYQSSQQFMPQIGYQQYFPVNSNTNSGKKSDNTDLILQKLPQKKGKEPERIVCRVCGKSFAKSCYYLQHHKAVHMKLLHRCKTCGKRFANEDQLFTHIKRHNDKEKEFKCSDCPKQFHYACDLKRHTVNHSTTSRYGCDVCKKKFARKDHMMKHKKTHFR